MKTGGSHDRSLFMSFTDNLKKLAENLSANTDFLVAFIAGIIMFTALYFVLIKFLFENDSGWMVALFTLLDIAGAFVFAVLRVDGALFLLFPAVFVICITVLYSVELKRIVWAKRNLKLADVKKGESRSYDEEKVENCISEIIKALQNMSKSDTGAIIVLSTDNVPSQIIDSGVKLDSDISSELIESVFFPKTPLHDGAMIINDTRIVAAGCFLPLSQNMDNIPKDLGTRHRAGIGITENIDVVSLIVSEETGIISIVRGGKITRYADSGMLRKTLTRYYWKELENSRR